MSFCQAYATLIAFCAIVLIVLVRSNIPPKLH